MPHSLSSSLTFFYKFIFPAVWLGGFAVGTFAVLVNAIVNTDATARGNSQALFIFFAMATSMGGAFLYEHCMRLKRVAIDGDQLLVSNYFTDFAVPLSEIESVTEIVWINIHPVTIIFRTEFPFGKSIVFMPKMRLYGMFKSHPIVNKLRALIGQTKLAAA